MAHTSEYDVENKFIDRLEGIGYSFIKMNSYDDVLANFRTHPELNLICFCWRITYGF